MKKSIYGNRSGFHTPNATTEVLQHLEYECPQHQFSDSSYSNDVCDSIMVDNLSCEEFNPMTGECIEHKEFKIFIPNSLVNDEGNERYSYFHISCCIDGHETRSSDDNPLAIDLDHIDKVVKYLNNITKDGVNMNWE